MFEFQSQIFSIFGVTLILCLLAIVLGGKIKKADPFARPTGAVVLVYTFVEFIDKLTVENTGKKAAKNVAPYIATILVYILTANISGIFGFNTPTNNLSVTIALALVSWTIFQYTVLKHNGLMGYIRSELLQPFAIFLPVNIISVISPILSMSIRLFGNIISGTIIGALVYAFTGYISSLVPVIGGFNFFAAIVAPPIHAVFDLFFGAIQAYVFTMLTVIFIGTRIPDEAKEF